MGAALAASPLCPASLPAELRARFSIPGVALGTDRGVTGVGRSGRDSDFIVQLCGPGRAPQSS